jgi:hypothetical protein
MMKLTGMKRLMTLMTLLVTVTAGAQVVDTTFTGNAVNINLNYAKLDSIIMALQAGIEGLETTPETTPGTSIPTYMLDLGEAEDGDFILEPGQLDVPLPLGNYGSIYIPEGASATIMPHQTSVIRVAGSFIVEGFLDGSGQNASGGQGPYNNGVHLMSSGGGKGGGYTGGGTQINNCNYDNETGEIVGFAPESFFSIDELGAQTTGSLDNFEGALQVFPYLHGGDGGPSYYWSGGNIYCGRAGGQGGGGLYVFASEITVSGYLWLNGGDGQGCYQHQYGYNATGGGGGGNAVLCGTQINVSGEFRADGGLGGGCSNTPAYAMTPAGDGQDGSLTLIER